MSRSINKAILMGKVVTDPKVKEKEGKPFVTSFSLLTKDNYIRKPDGKKIIINDFHNIVVFGKLSEIAANKLSNGNFVYLEGEIRTRKWQKEDGSYGKITQIITKEFHKIGKIDAFEDEEEDDDDIFLFD